MAELAELVEQEVILEVLAWEVLEERAELQVLAVLYIPVGLLAIIMEQFNCFLIQQLMR
jgi:hypothetical protein